MNRILINTFCALLLITTTYAQNVGIGTNQPDASAALDVNSSNKGLLIPRVDLAASTIAAPATGLMVFNTNNAFNNGAGLYINMGTTTAPQWMQLVPNTSGTFIRNSSAVQPNSSFNVSGNGVVGGALYVGNNTVVNEPALIVQSSNMHGSNMQIKSNTNTGYNLTVSGTISAVPGSLRLSNTSTGRTALFAVDNKISIGAPISPGATLDVYGDIKAQGSFLMDKHNIRREHTINSGARGRFILTCPQGYQVISGGGGHRDWNSAANDIEVSYTGPDPDNPDNAWRVMLQNTGGSARAVVIFCSCAKVK